MGAEVASIVTSLVIAGRSLARLIVPFTLNVIVVGPDAAFAAVIAARNEPAPELFRLLTVNLAPKVSRLPWSRP